MEVAVKILKVPPGGDRNDLKKAFHRELKACCAVTMLEKHPNILAILDAHWSKANQPLLAFEYLKNGNVREFISESRRQGKDVDKLQLIHNIASGMLFLHNRCDMVHSDLKPQNVLVDNNGIAKIADFGFARVRNRAPFGGESSGAGGGTRLYMPPERFFGAAKATKEGDIYAFGLTAFHIWTGRQPFEEHLRLGKMTLEEILKRKLRPAILHSDFMPPALEELICSCWSHAPGDRPTFVNVEQRMQEIRRL
ncbi:hypothetical protein HDU93_003654 [Gonapodya sp. JEL0774]|nr:hypothetical protein HDU93_003654 [Gonapodya sp. JEL0774]